MLFDGVCGGRLLVAGAGEVQACPHARLSQLSPQPLDSMPPPQVSGQKGASVPQLSAPLRQRHFTSSGSAVFL